MLKFYHKRKLRRWARDDEVRKAVELWFRRAVVKALAEVRQLSICY